MRTASLMNSSAAIRGPLSNNGMQATANSLRSSLASAIGGA